MSKVDERAAVRLLVDGAPRQEGGILANCKENIMPSCMVVALDLPFQNVHIQYFPMQLLNIGETSMMMRIRLELYVNWTDPG